MGKGIKCRKEDMPQKRVNRRKKCYMKILILDEDRGKIIRYKFPVSEIRFQGNTNKKEVKKNVIKKKPLYRILDINYRLNWSIEGKTRLYVRPEELTSLKIEINDGERKIRGFIIKAYIIGGGTTSSPAEGGLPPVDE